MEECDEDYIPVEGTCTHKNDIGKITIQGNVRDEKISHLDEIRLAFDSTLAVGTYTINWVIRNTKDNSKT